jgi:hypothetical protein
MNTPGDGFDTRVQGISGLWAATPAKWSYSSLGEVEACPRRWMLGRAAYPTIWNRSGYPGRPSPGGIRGTVMHRAIEMVLERLTAAGCPTVGDPAATAVLKALGGYTKLVETVLENELTNLGQNPRAAPIVDALALQLRSGVPEMRARVQRTVANIRLVAIQRKAAADSPAGLSAGILGPGSHPEVELQHEALRFIGRVDLLTIDVDSCEIIDFKTGERQDHHADQVQLYALLWQRDGTRNPDRLPVSSLALRYDQEAVPVDVPTIDELNALETGLRSRIETAESELRQRPPSANVGPETCTYCQVKHLCDEYWDALAPDAIDVAPGGLLDLAAEILKQTGARSWRVRLAPSGRDALIRMPNESSPFAVGDDVRFVGLRRGEDENLDVAELLLTTWTETHVLGGS